MEFSLIICTYKRPEVLLRLLDSIMKQEVVPNEVLVIDGSPDDKTLEAIKSIDFSYISYFKVGEKDRGLTRQRNYGIMRVNASSEIICFLDDDVILKSNYFKRLLETYRIKPNAIGVGGYILDEIEWRKNVPLSFQDFEMDGYVRKLGSRNVLRKRLGLLSDKPPGVMPEYSNGLSINFLPPSGKTYPVEFFMGGVSSYRKELLNKIHFSTFFVGYGLYEDMDFCLRASRIGHLYVNTAAQLYHHHEAEGRPNKYNYGKMVLRNGWYVWRVKYPKPSLSAMAKWHAIALLLTLVRLGNVFNDPNKKETLTEGLGRIAGWCSLFINKPRKLQ